MKPKTIPFLKTRVLESKRLLQKALAGVNRYAESLLQYQSQQQQQQQRPRGAVVHPQYSQQGGGLGGVYAQKDAKAVEKINRLAARLTVILDEMMILLKSKDTDTIYTKAGAILYYLDFILDPFLSSKPVVERNTWSLVPVKMLTTNPLRDTMMASSLTTMMGLVAAQKKKTKPSSFSLMVGQQAQQVIYGKPPVKASTSFLGIDLADMLPRRKRARE